MGMTLEYASVMVAAAVCAACYVSYMYDKRLPWWAITLGTAAILLMTLAQ